MTDFLLIDGKKFRSIEGYEGRYAVSDCGLVYSIPRVDERGKNRGGHYMKTRVCPAHGYVTVKLCSGLGMYRLHKVHLLVINAFGPKKPFEGALCRHLDDVKTHNKIGNLVWGTAKQNRADAKKTGLVAIGERNGGGKLTSDLVREIKNMAANTNLNNKQIGEKFSVSGVMVGRIISGKSWSHVQ